MAFFLPPDATDFPDVELADADGLLAMGGNLQMETLLTACKKGIFPWYSEGKPITWFCPDPRFVLFPGNIKISKSMRQVINTKKFDFYMNKDFLGVITNCKTIKRNGPTGTWITEDIERNYNLLFEYGYALSAEAWHNGNLVGGLYGVRLGKVFFGESMFAHESNASKFAFIKCVDVLQKKGVELIDCQVYTPHLESLGGEFIPRKKFTELLKTLID